MATCSPVAHKLASTIQQDGDDQTQRRHKRKSSQPKRLGEVLQMKRFRWDSNDESSSEDEEELAVERPSSSDSGCHTADSYSRPNVVKCEADEDIGKQTMIVAQQTCMARPRNYKSMNRQRRIEANARERSRVHTISAAFESLRRAVPAYADNQKLSKLAILRIASSYILSLACLNDLDYSLEQKKPDFAECVALCTSTIQSEGKTRRRSS